MKRLLITAVVAVAPILTAAMCTTDRGEPPVVVKEVDKPVPTNCDPKINAPAPLPSDAVPLNSDIFKLTQGVLGDRSQLIVETYNLRAALKGCQGPDAAAARLVSPQP